MKLLRRALLGLVSLGALLLCAELVLALAGLRFRFPPACDRDPGLGCMTKANAHVEFAFARRRFSFDTNALGLRDRDRSPRTTGQKRVLLLGDSLPFGVLVAAERTFPSLLEARLATQGIDVVNGGSIHLKGTEQQLAFYLDRGRRLRPDLVVLCFNAQNDLADSSHHLFFRPGAEGLERVLPFVPASRLHRVVLDTMDLAPVRFLDERSSLFGLARGLGYSLMHLPATTASPAEARAATEAAISRLALESWRDGAAFAVAVAPRPEAADDYARRGALPPESDERVALSIAAGMGLLHVDLTPSLLPVAGAPPRFQDDNHLTEAGHAQVAEALTPLLPLWLARQPAQLQ